VLFNQNPNRFSPKQLWRQLQLETLISEKHINWSLDSKVGCNEWLASLLVCYNLIFSIFRLLIHAIKGYDVSCIRFIRKYLSDNMYSE
jgi:alpha-amylase/alpha-mannosidase (GH57 family)